jgi:hypothetical protein
MHGSIAFFRRLSMVTSHVERKHQVLLSISLPLLVPLLIYSLLWVTHIALWPLLTHNLLLSLKVGLVVLAIVALCCVGRLAWHAARRWQTRGWGQIICNAALMGLCLTLAIIAIAMVPPAGKFFVQEESMNGIPLLLLYTERESTIAEVTLWSCDPVGIVCQQMMDTDVALEAGSFPVTLREDPAHAEQYQVLIKGVVFYTAYP